MADVIFDSDKEALAHIRESLETALKQAVDTVPVQNTRVHRDMILSSVLSAMRRAWDRFDVTKHVLIEVVPVDNNTVSVAWTPLTLLGCDMLEAMMPEMKDKCDEARAILSKPIEFMVNVTEFVEAKP